MNIRERPLSNEEDNLLEHLRQQYGDWKTFEDTSLLETFRQVQRDGLEVLRKVRFPDPFTMGKYPQYGGSYEFVYISFLNEIRQEILRRGLNDPESTS